MRRTTVVLAAALFFALPLIVTVAGPSEAAGLTATRECADFVSGDGLRRLSICARGWNDGSYVRGVVEMHTYARYNPGSYTWYDSRSQSITINDGYLFAARTEPFGNDDINTSENQGCRVNSPSGRVACSVPNVTRVAFYSARAPRGYENSTLVQRVTWRDDRGIAYDVFYGSGSTPDQLPIRYDWR